MAKTNVRDVVEVDWADMLDIGVAAPEGYESIEQIWEKVSRLPNSPASKDSLRGMLNRKVSRGQIGTVKIKGVVYFGPPTDKEAA